MGAGAAAGPGTGPGCAIRIGQGREYARADDGRQGRFPSASGDQRTAQDQDRRRCRSAALVAPWRECRWSIVEDVRAVRDGCSRA